MHTHGKHMEEHMGEHMGTGSTWEHMGTEGASTCMGHAWGRRELIP